MKKYVSVFLSAAMLCALTGCNDPESITEVANTPSTTTGEAITTEATETDDEAAETPEASSLAQALALKMRTWDQGNVHVTSSVEQDGQSVSVTGSMLGEQFAFDMNLADFIQTKIIYDGEKMYMLHDASKQYAETTPESEDASDDYESYFLDFAETEEPIATGTERIDDVSYTFEEFKTDDSTIRYYFDDNEALCYMYDADSDLSHVPISIEFMTSKDTSLYTIPEGYTSISEEEMVMLMMGDMFATLGEALEGIDMEGSVDFDTDADDMSIDVNSDFSFSFNSDEDED